MISEMRSAQDSNLSTLAFILTILNMRMIERKRYDFREIFILTEHSADRGMVLALFFVGRDAKIPSPFSFAARHGAVDAFPALTSLPPSAGRVFVFITRIDNNSEIFTSLSCYLIDTRKKMVYLHFPSNLTEEELMLQAKYNKLKRKVSSIFYLRLNTTDIDRSCYRSMTIILLF